MSEEHLQDGGVESRACSGAVTGGSCCLSVKGGSWDMTFHRAEETR